MDSSPIVSDIIEAEIHRGSSPIAVAPSRFSDFYELTKPRMNFLVVVTTMVGFYMAAGRGGDAKWLLLFHTLLGTALTASAAAVLNQFIERGFDALMPRTKHRPIPAGRINLLEALIFSCILGVSGTIYLYFLVNPLTAFLGAVTIIIYIFAYTPMKRSSTLCTVVGAIPGAIPPVMGYSAYCNSIPPAAFSLFAILFIWQMPHFLAIAVMYKDDYTAGGFKMLPCVDDAELSLTSRQMVLYSLCLIPVSLMPAVLGIAGMTYFIGAFVLGVGFLSFAVSAASSRTRGDARRLFFASIIYLPLLFTLLMLDKK